MSILYLFYYVFFVSFRLANELEQLQNARLTLEQQIMSLESTQTQQVAVGALQVTNQNKNKKHFCLIKIIFCNVENNNIMRLSGVFNGFDSLNCCFVDGCSSSEADASSIGYRQG